MSAGSVAAVEGVHPVNHASDRSKLFGAFNRLRAYSRRHPGVLDVRRVNRALGVAQRKQPRPYETTVSGCTCMDWLCRHRSAGPCKHILAIRLARLAGVFDFKEGDKCGQFMT